MTVVAVMAGLVIDEDADAEAKPSFRCRELNDLKLRRHIGPGTKYRQL